MDIDCVASQFPVAFRLMARGFGVSYEPPHMITRSQKCMENPAPECIKNTSF